MKVLVIGGGIAGCTCAALLKKYGVAEVTVIEKAPEFKSIGYLISLWGTGRKILKELGANERAEENGYEYETDTILDKQGRLIKEVTLASFKSLGPLIVIKRADLHRALFELLKNVDVRFNTYATRIEQSNTSATVEFNNGRKESFNLVVGADGVHSSTREQVFGPGFLRYYGWAVWMWWISNAVEQPKNATAYYGSGQVFATLPFHEKSVAIAVATVPPGIEQFVEGRKTGLGELFSGFCAGPRGIIEAAPTNGDIFHTDVAEVDMPRWHSGRVVLIGDAQHAVSPVTGMGASMAMEDASVLVEELQSRKDIDEALAYFAKRREKRIRHFRRMVNFLDGWTMVGGILGVLRNRIIPWIPDSYFVNTMHKFVNAEV